MRAEVCYMRTVLRVGPYRFFFFAGDRAEPPHVHVERDANRAKVWLDPVRLRESGGFPRAELGRSISAPLAWYPRLAHGTAAERANWRLIGRAEGLHWPDLDEDISVDNLLTGTRSGESDRSFKQWLASRESAT